MSAPAYAPLDDALEMLSHHGPDLTNGNFNHAPMVAEALCALGRPEAVFPWIESYRARLTPRPATVDRIDRDNWRSFLGRRDSFAAWSAYFARELAEVPWRTVLNRGAIRFAPGYSGAATHGAIRVGHAARGLAESETRIRLRELADALASWAASYSELPVAQRVAPIRLSPREALAAVPVVLPERRAAGNITTSLDRLVDFPEFARGIGNIVVTRRVPIEDGICDLAELFTRVYLANALDLRTFIVFVHGVTAIHAAGNMRPHVGIRANNLLSRHVWEAGCGLYAAFGGAPPVDTVEAGDGVTAALVDRAIQNGDEHVIKFTEACVACHKFAPSPVYSAAIRHALGVVRRR